MTQGSAKLRELMRQVIALGDLEDPALVPAAVVTAGRGLTGADRGLLVLGKGKRARLAIAQTDHEEAIEAFSRHVVAAVEHTGAAYRWDAPPSTSSAHWHATLAVPLRTRERWLGTLILAHGDARRRFDDIELEQVTMLADICAVAIDDARILIAHVREHMRLDEELAAIASTNRRLEEQVARQGQDLAHLQRQDAPVYGIERLVGESEAMQRLRKEVARYARTRLPILFQGEVGSGRDLAARVCHRLGPQGQGPLVVVPCAAIPEHLAQAELFGYAAGAFSGATADRPGWLAQADGGTVYLDGLEHLSPAVQAMLLRAIQEQQVLPLGADQPRRMVVRYLCSTTQDLLESVRQGLFREDLYHRLVGGLVAIPPLRERKEDIPALARSILLRSAGERASIDEGALRLLAAHDWPGNVRELANEIRQAVLASGGQIGREHVSPYISGRGLRSSASLDLPVGDLRASLRRHSERTLEYAGGNRSEAARLLGISRNTLARQLA